MKLGGATRLPFDPIVRSSPLLAEPRQSFHESSFVEEDETRMGIVTRHDHSINRIPWIDRQRSILIINTLESLCILTLARNDPTFRSLGHRCSSHAESNCNFSQRGNTGIRPPLLLLSTRAVRYTHATAIRLDGGHTITRLLIAARSCTPRLVFAYLVCQCCIDHLQGGERGKGMTTLCRRTVSGRRRQRRRLEDDWEGRILCNEIPRRFHTRMQIPSSIELCRLSCRGQNERIPGFRGKRMEEKKRKEKRGEKRIESLTHPGRVGYALVGLTVRNDHDFS